MSTGGVKAHVAASCGCKAGWFEMVARKQSVLGLLGATICPLGDVKAHVAASCGCKAGWFERWLSRP